MNKFKINKKQMALQINTTLTTKDGGSVASGSHVVFGTRFNSTELKYTVGLQIYRSLVAMNNGVSELDVVEIPTLRFKKELTEEEFALLTPIIVHEHVKAFLEESVGEGNVVII